MSSPTPAPASSSSEANVASSEPTNNNKDPEVVASTDPPPTSAAVPAAPKGSRKRKHHSQRGGVHSPVFDAALAAALSQAVPLLSDEGFCGVASLLSSSSTNRQLGASSSSFLATLLSQAGVESAVNKTLQDTPPWIHWSKLDCAPAPDLVVQPPQRLVLRSSKGYRMGRATVGVSPAPQKAHFLQCHYYEVVLLPGPTAQEIYDNLPPNARLGPKLQAQLERALEKERKRKQDKEQNDNDDEDDDDSDDDGDDDDRVGGHVRVGWSMRTGDLQAPVGYDQWSYGIRSVDGGLLHKSQRLDGTSWGGEGFEAGDVLGCAISLDQQVPLNNHVRFFKNGVSLGQVVLVKGKRAGGEAFSEITSGTYYPAASGYLGGSVRANFGPHWICPPRKLPAGFRFVPLPAPTVPSVTNPKVATILKLFRTEAQKQELSTALETESRMLATALESYQQEHIQFVRQERELRRLSVNDLPLASNDAASNN